MKKILITGAGGYIGSNAVYVFLQKGYEVIAIDNFVRGFREPLELLEKKFGREKLRTYEADLTSSVDSIFEQEKNIEAVVHFAAFCNVGESMEHPELYFKNNTFGTANLLRSLTENGIKNIIFSSTCAVYGQSQYMPLDEKHPISPMSVYGESKRMSELEIEWYARQKALKYVKLRYFNVCGASDDSLIGDSKKPSFHLMQNAVRAALGIAPFELICPEVDTPDKTPIRDYVNVVDLADAHVLALEYLLNNNESEVFNLGTGSGNSVLEIIQTVQNVTGRKFELGHGKERQGDPARLFADNTHIRQVLGWEPKRSIEDSVRSLVKWYESRPNGWQR